MKNSEKIQLKIFPKSDRTIILSAKLKKGYRRIDYFLTGNWVFHAQREIQTYSIFGSQKQNETEKIVIFFLRSQPPKISLMSISLVSHSEHDLNFFNYFKRKNSFFWFWAKKKARNFLQFLMVFNEFFETKQLSWSISQRICLSCLKITNWYSKFKKKRNDFFKILQFQILLRKWELFFLHNKC